MTFAEGEDKPRNDSIVFSAENSCKNPTTIFNMTTAATTPPSIYEPIPSETPNASNSTNIIALTICFTRILGQATPVPLSNYPNLSAQLVTITAFWGVYSIRSVLLVARVAFGVRETRFEISVELSCDILDGE